MIDARSSQFSNRIARRSGRRTCVLVASAVAALCFHSAANAGQTPSYTDPAKHQVECEKDTPTNRAIRGCTDLEKNPAADPGVRIRAYSMRGFSWLKDEAPEAAIADFSRIIAIDSDNPTAYKGRAWAYERLYRYADAIKDWTRLIELKPGDAELHRERAYTYHLDRKYSLAVDDFTRVLELDEKNLDSRIGRALAYDALDKLPEALADFEQALQLNPEYTAVFVARGEMWERRTDHKKAVADYQRAYRLGATGNRVRSALARLGSEPPGEKTQ
ncbi:MAG: tetratricopeptide repeat protein [Alphaproteobacteria bacterium]|nr:tetratricopeptide repeat protein [Alphaproteobacteria bacterium]